MSACGLWRDTHRLVAVIVYDDDTHRRPLIVRATAENTQHLLAYLATAQIGPVILSDQQQYVLEGITELPPDIRLVPHELLAGIRAATGLYARPSHQTARLLARWYLTEALRPHLRPRTITPQNLHQLDLF